MDAFFGRAVRDVLICRRRTVVAADQGQFIDANAEFLLVAVNVFHCRLDLRMAANAFRSTTGMTRLPRVIAVCRAA